MRVDFIEGENKNNEIITRFDFSDFKSDIIKLDSLLLQKSVKKEIDDMLNIFKSNPQIDNFTSGHMPKNSGYINSYLVEADKAGELIYDKTIDKIRSVEWLIQELIKKQ
jgi:hypothetical protein